MINIDKIMKISNVRVYGMEESIIASGYPMQSKPVMDIDDMEETYKLEVINKGYKRARSLGNAEAGSGHDCYLKGIITQFDLQAPEYFWRQFDRYHFRDYVSSQSKMHMILKFDIDQMCNKYVSFMTIEVLKFYIDQYNNFEEGKFEEMELRDGTKIPYTKENCFNMVVANIPSGFMLTARITTNYLQLKGIRKQRKHHKLQEWHIFNDFLSQLPSFDELTNKKK